MKRVIKRKTRVILAAVRPGNGDGRLEVEGLGEGRGRDRRVDYGPGGRRDQSAKQTVADGRLVSPPPRR